MFGYVNEEKKDETNSKLTLINCNYVASSVQNNQPNSNGWFSTVGSYFGNKLGFSSPAPPPSQPEPEEDEDEDEQVSQAPLKERDFEIDLDEIDHLGSKNC